jgi:hypothetical protein
MHIAYTEGHAETTIISEHCAVHCRPPCRHDFYRKSTTHPRNNVSINFAISEPKDRNSCCVYGIIWRDFENQWCCPKVKSMGGEDTRVGALKLCLRFTVNCENSACVILSSDGCRAWTCMLTGRVGCHSAVHCRPQPVWDSYPIYVRYPRIHLFNLMNLNQRA